MASLTGCLTDDDSSVDETTDTTSDNTDTTQDGTDTTDDTKDDELIEPVGVTGYTPPDEANITVDAYRDLWIAKDGHRITTPCDFLYSSEFHLHIFDSENNMIYAANGWNDYGAVSNCWNSDEFRFDVTLGPEPAKVGLWYYNNDSNTIGYYTWFVTF